jgi:sulfur carrier protein
MTVSVTVNGELYELTEGTSIATLLESLNAPGSGRGVAVALDGEVVPHGAWTGTAIGPGARIEVVVAVQGG